VSFLGHPVYARYTGDALASTNDTKLKPLTVHCGRVRVQLLDDRSAKSRCVTFDRWPEVKKAHLPVLADDTPMSSGPLVLGHTSRDQHSQKCHSDYCYTHIHCGDAINTVYYWQLKDQIEHFNMQAYVHFYVSFFLRFLRASYICRAKQASFCSFSACVSVCQSVCVFEKLQNTNWCKLLRICIKVNDRNYRVDLVIFDLDYFELETCFRVLL